MLKNGRALFSTWRERDMRLLPYVNAYSLPVQCAAVDLGRQKMTTTHFVNS